MTTAKKIGGLFPFYNEVNDGKSSNDGTNFFSNIVFKGTEFKPSEINVDSTEEVLVLATSYQTPGQLTGKDNKYALEPLKEFLKNTGYLHGVINRDAVESAAQKQLSQFETERKAREAEFDTERKQRASDFAAEMKKQKDDIINMFTEENKKLADEIIKLEKLRVESTGVTLEQVKSAIVDKTKDIRENALLTAQAELVKVNEPTMAGIATLEEALATERQELDKEITDLSAYNRAITWRLTENDTYVVANQLDVDELKRLNDNLTAKRAEIANKQEQLEELKSNIQKAATLSGGSQRGGASNLTANPVALAFYNEVFGKWSTYTPAEQHFYNTFVEVKKGKGKDEVKLTPGDEYPPASSDMSMEITLTGKVTVFQEHIPRLNLTGVTPDVLQAAYGEGYDRGQVADPAQAGGGPMNLFTKKTAFSTNSLDLDWRAILKSMHMNDNKSSKDCCKDALKPDELCGIDGLHTSGCVDMAFGKIWDYDCTEKGTNDLFRMVDGKRQDYSDFRTDNELGLGTEEATSGVLNCLFSGNAGGLSKCMSEVSDANAWVVAENDIKKADPKMVKKLLFKLGFKGIKKEDDKKNPYTNVMSFNEWVKDGDETKISKDMRKEISRNPKLCKYLTSIVSFCNANPVIINKFQPVLAAGPGNDASELALKMGMNRTYDPRHGMKSEAYTVEALRRIAANGSLIPAMMPRGIAGLNAGFMPNTRHHYSFGGHQGMMGQRGGGKHSLTNGSGTIFEELFSYVRNGLSNVGLKMADTDHQAIEKAVKNIKHLEDQLIILVNRYSSAIKVGNSLGVNRMGSKEPLTSVQWDELETEDQARDFMTENINTLRSKYSSVHGQYAGLTTDYFGLMARLAERCCPQDGAKNVKSSKWTSLDTDCAPKK